MDVLVKLSTICKVGPKGFQCKLIKQAQKDSLNCVYNTTNKGIYFNLNGSNVSCDKQMVDKEFQ